MIIFYGCVADKIVVKIQFAMYNIHNPLASILIFNCLDCDTQELCCQSTFTYVAMSTSQKLSTGKHVAVQINDFMYPLFKFNSTYIATQNHNYIHYLRKIVHRHNVFKYSFFLRQLYKDGIIYPIYIRTVVTNSY